MGVGPKGRFHERHLARDGRGRIAGMLAQDAKDLGVAGKKPPAGRIGRRPQVDIAHLGDAGGRCPVKDRRNLLRCKPFAVQMGMALDPDPGQPQAGRFGTLCFFFRHALSPWSICRPSPVAGGKPWPPTHCDVGGQGVAAHAASARWRKSPARCGGKSPARCGGKSPARCDARRQSVDDALRGT